MKVAEVEAIYSDDWNWEIFVSGERIPITFWCDGVLAGVYRRFGLLKSDMRTIKQMWFSLHDRKAWNRIPVKIVTDDMIPFIVIGRTTFDPVLDHLLLPLVGRKLFLQLEYQ